MNNKFIQQIKCWFTFLFILLHVLRMGSVCPDRESNIADGQCSHGAGYE